MSLSSVSDKIDIGGVDQAFNHLRSLSESVRRDMKEDLPKMKEPHHLPILSPLDLLRLRLDEEWGATLGRDVKSGDVCLGGAVRFMRGGREKEGNQFIHVDDLSPISPSLGTFSANIYLKMPPSSFQNHPINENPSEGSLAIWPIEFRSRWQFLTNASFLSSFTTSHPNIQRSLLNQLPPPIEIHPQKGDLVILCVQRPHCVLPITTSQERISFQTFISYKKDKPLSLEV